MNVAPVTDEPVAGFYKARLVKNGPYVPLRIYHGQPIIRGERQDRPCRWVVLVNGQTDFREAGQDGYAARVPFDVYRFWPHCARWPLERWEYRLMIAKKTWAEKWAPSRPEASPRVAIDKRGKSIF